MMNTEQYREHIERTFNAFCKIVLYHAALNAYKKLRKKQQFEVSFDYLREFDFEPVTTTDEHFVKYDVPTVFTVRGGNGHCGKRAVGSRAFASAGKAARSPVFTVLPRLQRYGNREAVWSLQKYNLPQTEKSIAFAAKRNGGVRE